MKHVFTKILFSFIFHLLACCGGNVENFSTGENNKYDSIRDEQETQKETDRTAKELQAFQGELDKTNEIKKKADDFNSTLPHPCIEEKAKSQQAIDHAQKVLNSFDDTKQINETEISISQAKIATGIYLNKIKKRIEYSRQKKEKKIKSEMVKKFKERRKKPKNLYQSKLKKWKKQVFIPPFINEIDDVDTDQTIFFIDKIIQMNNELVSVESKKRQADVLYFKAKCLLFEEDLDDITHLEMIKKQAEEYLSKAERIVNNPAFHLTLKKAKNIVNNYSKIVNELLISLNIEDNDLTDTRVENPPPPNTPESAYSPAKSSEIGTSYLDDASVHDGSKQEGLGQESIDAEKQKETTKQIAIIHSTKQKLEECLGFINDILSIKKKLESPKVENIINNLIKASATNSDGFITKLNNIKISFNGSKSYPHIDKSIIDKEIHYTLLQIKQGLEDHLQKLKDHLPGTIESIISYIEPTISFECSPQSIIYSIDKQDNLSEEEVYEASGEASDTRFPRTPPHRRASSLSNPVTNRSNAISSNHHRTPSANSSVKLKKIVDNHLRETTDAFIAETLNSLKEDPSLTDLLKEIQREITDNKNLKDSLNTLEYNLQESISTLLESLNNFKSMFSIFSTQPLEELDVAISSIEDYNNKGSIKTLEGLERPLNNLNNLIEKK